MKTICLYRYRLLVTIVLILNIKTSLLRGAAEDYDFSLITIGPGDPLYSTAGHSVLRVKSRDSDLIYNWGIFNSRQDGFVNKFVQQTLLYRVGITNFNNYLSIHKDKNRLFVEDGRSQP